jgi:hypothetical protein
MQHVELQRTSFVTVCILWLSFVATDSRTHQFGIAFVLSLQMPYLIRRANENSSIASAANKELGMLHSELTRRVTGNKQVL